jgi:hypothetical protein
MRSVACSLLMLLAASGVANAQTTPDLQIQLGVYIVSPFGGEQPAGVWRNTGPVVMGKPVSSTYSFGTSCEAWMVSTDGSLREDATTAWRIDITPIRIVRHAVTFRLRWVRTAGLQQLSEEDIELRLGPGESWLVDSVRVPPGAKMVDGRPCGRTASIRVSVDRFPSAEAEHRLIGAELWLVERLQDGAEVQRSQPLAVRGLPGRPFTYYFDSIVDAEATLDIYGILIARRFGEEIAVSVETRSRWAPELRNIHGAQHFVNSEIRVHPSETVEIRLPLMGDEAGPFAKRSLSIRIRARQLR